MTDQIRDPRRLTSSLTSDLTRRRLGTAAARAAGGQERAEADQPGALEEAPTGEI